MNDTDLGRLALEEQPRQSRQTPLARRRHSRLSSIIVRHQHFVLMQLQSSQQDRAALSGLLQLRRDNSSLGVAESVWRLALEQATPDPVVGIRHANIQGEENYRIHVAAIPQQVGCHVHRKGDEDYSVVEGEGILHFGLVSKNAAGPLVQSGDWKQMLVAAGDSFIIPEGYAHQLRRAGKEDLTILFGCPDSHLDDSKDRTMLPDAPR